MLKTLTEHPLAGQEAGQHSRIYQISRTPFAVIYRVRRDQIEILAILDQRADNPPFE